jgi:hypothetical protein
VFWVSKSNTVKKYVAVTELASKNVPYELLGLV